MNLLDLSDIICEKCKRNFGRGEPLSLYNGKNYHNRCFVCSFCDKPLAGQGFYIKADGLFQCNKCHSSSLPKCWACDGSISDGAKFSVYKDKKYHRTCFKCVKCDGVIDEGQSFVDSRIGVTCTDCANPTNNGLTGMSSGKPNYSARKPETSSAAHSSGRDHMCVKCSRPIKANIVYGTFEGKQYHQECFTCNRCGKNLIDCVSRRLGSAIVCEDCS